MKTKLVILILSFVATTFFIHSCSDNSVEQNSNNSGVVESAITDELAALIDIREEITQFVIDRKVDIDQLKKAYFTNDNVRIMHLMNMSKQDYDSFNERLKNLSNSILEKYPDIRKEVEGLKKQGFTPCNSDVFFNNFESYTFASKRQGTGLSKISGGGGSEEVDCQWAQYTAGLILCASTGPYFYWPCAYLVVCSYCSGGWVDDVCL